MFKIYNYKKGYENLKYGKPERNSKRCNCVEEKEENHTQ